MRFAAQLPPPSFVGAVPPLRECALSWRELYAMDCLFQNELVTASELESASRILRIDFGKVGREHLERWDEAGALRPIAFALAPYISMGAGPALPLEAMVFRDEAGFKPWKDYERDEWGTITALYSRWQLLLLHDVLKAERARVPLEVLLRDSGRDEWAESYRGLFAEQHRQWSYIQEWWDPLLRVLVRLQNRYWPLVHGRVILAFGENGERYNPEEAREFEPQKVRDELGVSAEDIFNCHQLLARRGAELEPGDDWYLLRQMAPRHRRAAFVDEARRAQDFYDAADILRRYYLDLTGELLPDAQVMAGGRDEAELALSAERREKLLGHGPRIAYDADDAKRVLGVNGIYPHGIHVIVEGETEEALVSGLVEMFLGREAVADLVITNLRGVGSATRIESLLGAVTDYARQTVVIADNEGAMKREIDRLVGQRLLDADDVLIQDTSLEEENLSHQGLVDLAVEVAAKPPGGRPAAVLTLTGEGLRAYHEDRLSRSSGRDKKGLADSLVTLAQRAEHGSVRISKPELAAAFLALVRQEFEPKSWYEIKDAAGQWPVVAHIVTRVIEPLAQAPLDRPRRRRK